MISLVLSLIPHTTYPNSLPHNAAPFAIADIYSPIPSFENQFSLKSSHSYSSLKLIRFSNKSIVLSI